MIYLLLLAIFYVVFLGFYNLYVMNHNGIIRDWFFRPCEGIYRNTREYRDV